MLTVHLGGGAGKEVQREGFCAHESLDKLRLSNVLSVF